MKNTNKKSVSNSFESVLNALLEVPDQSRCAYRVEITLDIQAWAHCVNVSRELKIPLAELISRVVDENIYEDRSHNVVSARQRVRKSMASQKDEEALSRVIAKNSPSGPKAP